MSLASAAAIGPWALVIMLVLMLGAALSVVFVVLARGARGGERRTLAVRVRLLGLLRVEIELGDSVEPDAASAEVVPLREDTA
jgi:hypothetical protein